MDWTGRASMSARKFSPEYISRFQKPMCHMQTPPSGGGDHRERSHAKQTAGTLALAAASVVVVGGASGVLIKTLIVVPPNKADATATERETADGSSGEGGR